MGHGNEVLYNMPRLPQHGIVLVNVNMRLGLIGLLAHPSLSKESPDGASGNYMFLDMIAALKWVQRNISAFGGDPDNVTIFGESGGGRKVTAMLASPLAKGLFHRCIVESGGECGSPLKDNETKGEKFFELLGCDKEPDPLSAARAQSLEKLMEAQKLFVKDLQRSGPAGPWDASVDGWFLPDTTANIFKAGKQNRVPFIVGANLGEVKDHVGNQRILYYTDTLSGMKDVEWYAYIFDQVPAGWRKNNVTSAHAMELCYVFGDWDNSSGFWKIVMSIAGPNAIKSPDPGVTAVDKQVAEKMMSIWTQFAKTGNPGASGLTEWPAYDPDDEKYLYIAEELDVRSGFSKLAMK
jgi:para-nitrobenzyl esterase